MFRISLNLALILPKIPDSVIAFIKANEKMTSEKIRDIECFKPAQSVRITDGVFKNFIAIFKSLKSDERVILLMNILGQQQTLNIKRKSIIGL